MNYATDTANFGMLQHISLTSYWQFCCHYYICKEEEERKQHYIDYIKNKYKKIGTLDETVKQKIEDEANNIKYVFETLAFGERKRTFQHITMKY